MKLPFWLRTLALGSSCFAVANGAPVDISITHQPGETNPIAVTWETIPGKSYNLLSTEYLNPALWVALNPAPLVAATNRQVYRDTNAGSRYYRVIELAPKVEVDLVGISEQAWQASDVWVPATLSPTVSGSKTLITLGAWWDASFPAMPTDTAGIFTEAVKRLTNNTRWPVRVQVAYQGNAALGGHEIRPQSVGSSGDGFFLLLETAGLTTESLVRDSGYASDFEPNNPPADPIRTITTTTYGSAAQVGDLAVAIFVMDTASNSPDINISLPSGWTSLGYNDAVVDNVGYRACYKIVTMPGQQAVTCNWTDDRCVVAEAAIVVFSAAASSP